MFSTWQQTPEVWVYYRVPALTFTPTRLFVVIIYSTLYNPLHFLLLFTILGEREFQSLLLFTILCERDFPKRVLQGVDYRVLFIVFLFGAAAGLLSIQRAWVYYRGVGVMGE